MADAGEDVEADLGVVHAGGCGAVADRDDEEDEECEDQRRFGVFGFVAYSLKTTLGTDLF